MSKKDTTENAVAETPATEAAATPPAVESKPEFDFSHIPDVGELAAMLEALPAERARLKAKEAALKAHIAAVEAEAKKDITAYALRVSAYLTAKQKPAKNAKSGTHTGSAHYEGRQASEAEVLALLATPEFASGEKHIGDISKALSANAGATLKSLREAGKVRQNGGTARGTRYMLA